MAKPSEKVGKQYEPCTAVIDADRARAYAAATNDDNPAYESGKYAPPVFGVVPAWDAMLLVAADVIPPDALPFVVHGEQDMLFHRPLEPGTTLTTHAEVFSVRVGPSGTRATSRLVSVDHDGTPVLEQYNTAFVRGLQLGDDAGPDKPDHSFPAAARDKRVGEYTIHVDDDQTFRYRDASGDQMPIHVDDAFARNVGLPGIIVHGLCTMAMCSQAVIRTLADGDPSRLARLAVRFSKPVFPGRDVTVVLYDAADAGDGRHAYAFEATSAGDVVIKDGRAELSS